MIILRYKGSKEIVDIFDTAKEFKEYINEYLSEVEVGMKEDNLDTVSYGKLSFEQKLKEYFDIEDELEVEIK